MKKNVISIAYYIMMVHLVPFLVRLVQRDVTLDYCCTYWLKWYKQKKKQPHMPSIQRDCAWHTMNCRLYITLDILQRKMDFYTWGHNCHLLPSARATGCCLQLLKLPLWPDKSPCTNPSLSPARFCNLLKLTIHIKLAFSRLVYGNMA